MKKILVGIATLLLSAQSYAAPHKAGDSLFRAGFSSTITTGSKTKVDFDDSNNNYSLSMDEGYSLGLNFSYFFNRNWAVEVATSSPSKHNIELSGDDSSTKFAEISNIPLIFSALYYPDKDWDIKPYIGAGIHYTFFFADSFTTAGEALSFKSLDVSNSYGIALQAGVDYQITKSWSLNASTRFHTLSSDTSFDYKSEDKGSSSIDMNPWIISVMVGYQF